MPITRYGFESGANLDPATAPNTGANSTVASGGSMAISTSWAKSGSRSLKCIATSTSGVVYASYTVTSSTSIYIELFIYLTGSPSAEIPIMFIGTGATRCLTMGLTTTRGLIVRDAGGAGGAAIATLSAVPLNTAVKVCFVATQSATTGTLRVAWSDTSPYGTFNSDSGSLTSKNTGAAAYDTVRIGAKASTGIQTLDAIYYDDWGYQTGLSAFPTTPPVINGTQAQSSYVFLDMSLTTFDVGPIAYSASPSTGTVPAASGIFLPAPASGTTTYTVTATDTGNGGTATTSVDVDAQTGGVERVIWTGISWA